jgi:GNAT superfamily N-acetyltransferase
VLSVRPLEPALDLAGFLRVLAEEEAVPTTAEQWWQADAAAGPAAFRRFLVGEEDGAIVAVAAVFDHPFDTDSLVVRLHVERARRRRGHGGAMAAAVAEAVAERRPAAVEARVRDDLPESQAWAERRGFEPYDHAFQSRLDLQSFDPGPHQAVVESADAAGIRFVTPDDQDRLYDLYSRLLVDAPDHLQPPTREYFRQRLGPERGALALVAVDGDVWVGLTLLEAREPDGAWNAMTGVLPEHRGKGLARALKVLVAGEARRRGLRWIGTTNNARNGPMLAVNQALGYQRLVGIVRLRKLLTSA